MFPQSLILTLLFLSQWPHCWGRQRVGMEVGNIDLLEQDTFDGWRLGNTHIPSWPERTKKENCILYDYPSEQYCEQYYPSRHKSQVIYKNEDHLLIAWLILIIMMFVVYLCIYF